MANADGSVIFSCDLDSTKAQKKLSKLRDEISELNSKLEKETGNKMNLEKQLDAASQAAKATEERVKMLRKEVERLNDREWIQKQGFTQNEYQTQVLDRRAGAGTQGARGGEFRACQSGPVCRAFQRSGQEFSALYACVLSHHGGAHGAAQADQGGY